MVQVSGGHRQSAQETQMSGRLSDVERHVSVVNLRVLVDFERQLDFRPELFSCRFTNGRQQRRKFGTATQVTNYFSGVRNDHALRSKTGQRINLGLRDHHTPVDRRIRADAALSAGEYPDQAIGYKPSEHSDSTTSAIVVFTESPCCIGTPTLPRSRPSCRRP